MSSKVVHPGVVLLNEYLQPYNITREEFAKTLDLAPFVLDLYIQGQKNITAEFAWRLADALNTSPRMWMNLQVEYDLWKVRPGRG